MFYLQVDDIPPEQHALVPSYMAPDGGGGRRIHPLPFSDSAPPGNYSYSANCLGKLGDLGFSFFLLSLVNKRAIGCCSATKIVGSFKGLGRLWLWKYCLEGKDGELEAKTGQTADNES